jgi:hypothetical protein
MWQGVCPVLAQMWQCNQAQVDPTRTSKNTWVKREDTPIVETIFRRVAGVRACVGGRACVCARACACAYACVRV